MKIRSAKAVGAAIKQRRRELGMDQSTLANQIGASRQWVIAVEQGKDSAEIGRVLRALDAVGLAVSVAAAGEARSGKSASLPKIDIDSIVTKALARKPQKPARAAK